MAGAVFGRADGRGVGVGDSVDLYGEGKLVGGRREGFCCIASAGVEWHRSALRWRVRPASLSG